MIYMTRAERDMYDKPNGVCNQKGHAIYNGKCITCSDLDKPPQVKKDRGWSLSCGGCGEDLTDKDINAHRCNTKQDFNGGYCIASEEAHNALVEYGYIEGVNAIKYYAQQGGYLYVKDNHIWANMDLEYVKLKGKHGQFYIVDGKPCWNKKSFVDEVFDMPIMGAKMRGLEKETISITAEDGTVYEWGKPCWWDSDCEFFFREDTGNFIGKVDKTCVIWNPIGEAIISYTNEKMPSWNLTPIKKQWYEDESNFPALIVSHSDVLAVAYHVSEEYFEDECGNNIALKNLARLATEDEVLSVNYYGKEK